MNSGSDSGAEKSVLQSATLSVRSGLYILDGLNYQLDVVVSTTLRW